MQNRVFFPQDALNQWLVDGTVELSGSELTILEEQRKYRLAEAIRVLREVTGGHDPYELVGRVKSRPYLEELGAELLEGSMIVGDNAYDVVPGWVGMPIGSFEEHKAARPTRNTWDAEPTTDEDLLARFLVQGF